MLQENDSDSDAWRAHLESLNAEINMSRDWVVVQPGESDNVFWGADAILKHMQEKAAPVHIILGVSRKVVVKLFLESTGPLSSRVCFHCYSATDVQLHVRVLFEVLEESTPAPRHLRECAHAPITRWRHEDVVPCALSAFMPNYEARRGQDEDGGMWQMNLDIRLTPGAEFADASLGAESMGDLQ